MSYHWKTRKTSHHESSEDVGSVHIANGKTRRGIVTTALVGTQGSGYDVVDVIVDRRSVLGNPFYDAWPVSKWFTDCLAYRRFMSCVLSPGGPQDDEGLLACVESVATESCVTVSDRWRKRPPRIAAIRQEMKRLQSAILQGKHVRLLCHCSRPFRELGGQFSPCHAEAIAEELDPLEMPAYERKLLDSPFRFTLRNGDIRDATEQFAVFICDCAGLHSDADESVKQFVHRFPHADPYRRRRRGYVSAVPGSIAVYDACKKRNERGIIAVFGQVLPGRPEEDSSKDWIASLSEAADLCGKPVEDSVLERIEWLWQGFTRVLRLADLQELAFPAATACLPSSTYLGLLDALAEIAKKRGVNINVYQVEDMFSR